MKQETGDRRGIANTLGELVNLCQVEGKLTEAEALYQRAIALSERVGDPVGTNSDMFNLALLYERQERLAEALPLLERVVETDERVRLPNLEQDRRVLERVRRKLSAGR
jgi:tetratricopeptide (TPR) repeat protein